MKNSVIVVGAGGAGLVAALNAHKSGAKVIVITKEYPTRSQTSMAQGGINAALSNIEEDSIELHVQNTLKSAHGLANIDAVNFLCQSAPEAVMWLDSIGVPFSRTKENKIAQRKLGGAYAARACYAQDYTGLKILHTLYDRCLAEGIEILNERYLLEFITCFDKDKPFVSGVSVLNKRDGEVEIYEAQSVVVATGGYSRVFHNYSTNSVASSGDGIASAFRAGARVSDMEFIQFHPTALKNSSILISESARGAGGYLVNSMGDRFTNELAPRDEVARAINDEILKGNDVFLDIRHLGEEFIKNELPQEAKLAKLYENIDPVYDLIPIKPAAHYTMGGIEVDENSSTCIDGLYAVGECANHKVHGANRLGGNSLLELIVFGKQAGESAAKYAKNFDKTTDMSGQKNIADEQIREIKEHKNKINFYAKQRELGELFYKYVGIKRDKLSLQNVLNEVIKIKKDLQKMGVSDKTKEYNTNLIEFLEFKNMLELCELILISALSRQESRGAHFRVDAPNINEKFEAHTVVSKERVVSYEN
ncbi:MAG: succinate dehydrogenase [Sulfurimonas sp. RIFCSPLOWO2_12_FULL_36_74]|uniref:FAD-dependent oxidoreductase n=1 Tax=Sulfurimonas sp. RIFCSPLOWO2_12_36_12 TaxID=1802253 RepID=UPI0008AF15D2|nr:FAD-dependent oxidoreductase [Sulfurimonas sp. RIFCSPLOWO2_12_36_12]OHD97279.1 MAG: succinate dehydrogenase [Sulfurimonas sp. RIFCSPLOWO2_02_FULL_36_28]OHE00671.1 MAG: succinate dehydrogenase [Sulfurimonas sp. RIFCSPLOWO2_12_36_12]OHE07782.1 MAG: succinate dehydrogenase [Sulfurimonas sp. RIFCSPLOWO2_12_FULL_36_74]